MFQCKQGRAPDNLIPIFDIPLSQHTEYDPHNILSVKGDIWLGSPPLLQETTVQAVFVSHSRMPYLKYSLLTDFTVRGRVFLRRNSFQNHLISTARNSLCDLPKIFGTVADNQSHPLRLMGSYSYELCRNAIQ